jgi:hypothetical protein
MSNKPRDIGREIDSAEPSPELKRAVARDIEQNAGRRSINTSQADEIPDAPDETPDEEAPSHRQKPDNTTRGLNPDPEKLSTREAQEDERPGS